MGSRSMPDGRKRVVIENVKPCVDGGRFPAKRCAGGHVMVEADIFIDGHEVLRAILLHRRRGTVRWNEADLAFVGNDHWQASFDVPELGAYEYAVTAWPDAFSTWRHDLARWTDPDDVLVSLQVGARLLGETARRSRGADARALRAWKERLETPGDPMSRRADALEESLAVLVSRYADRRYAATSDTLTVAVDPPRAGFSAWYELFPRSAGTGRAHGTFRDVEALLPYVAGMGFDVLYLPPIHPIGTTKRKGRNNALAAAPGDPGSPWAIGSAEGGHKAIHPALGTPEEFRHLVAAARDQGIDVAIDIAFQCSPDHPYVSEHPSWFRHRPDGSIQYAENPPKKYQDIYPFNFDTDDWKALWHELRSVFEHWIREGVRIFRVDNPHTKPYPMWEWMLGELRREHPDTIFLAEAFTRPHPMHWLAKLGFNQSYTYFTWRNTKQELTDYFVELTQQESREYFRPNVWPNTPDILHEYLQSGGRPAFVARLVLAATLSANYGIYGPAFELMEHVPREPKSEEYLDSEKYEIKAWNRDRPDSLRRLIARVNSIRGTNRAMHDNWRLRFHGIDNPQLLCYAKTTEDLSNVILAVVNLDPRHTQSGWTHLALADLGVDPAMPFEVHDLLTDARYRWQGAHNYVELRPAELPAHIFRVRGPRTTA
ncbi:MAG TPA: alpha-1,4-glucan--maltose-1-phosphate maltosyltransferase [Casimicrobiaceae bacterium]